MVMEIRANGREITVIQRLWGGWLAVAKDRPLAASGGTATEARIRLEETMARFDGWAEEWERDHSAEQGGTETLRP